MLRFFKLTLIIYALTIDSDTFSMKKTTKGNKKIYFYVVQFIQLPNKDIEHYVCVPSTWLIIRPVNDGKVAVGYPKNENPFLTKERVKRRERFNSNWKFYKATIKYQAATFKEAEDWIASQSTGAFNENEESEVRDTQSEPVLNRKLRSAMNPTWLCSKSVKPQLIVKPYDNPWKPLSRISVKRPSFMHSREYMNYKRLKVNGTAQPSVIISHTSTKPAQREQEQSEIIETNQLIQSSEKEVNNPANDQMSAEQNAQSKLSEEHQLVDMSIQTPPKLTFKRSHEKEPSPKLTAEKQPSSVGQDGEQPHSKSVIGLDECDDDINVDLEFQPESVTEERSSSSKTPSNIAELHPTPELLKEGSVPLVHYEHSFPEPHPQNIPSRQSKEIGDNQRTQLHRILTMPAIVPRPPSTAGQLAQQYEYIYNYQRPQSQRLMDDTPATPCQQPNSNNLSAQPHKPIARRQSSFTKIFNNSIEEQTRTKNIAKRKSTVQPPLNLTKQSSSSISSFIIQAPLAQEHLQSSMNVNNAISTTGGICVDQSVPLQRVGGTSAVQNLSSLAHQSQFFVQPAHGQQYVSTPEDYLQQIAHMQDTLRRSSMPQNIDQRAYPSNIMMNRGFAIPNQPHPTYPPTQFFPRQENHHVPAYNAYVQEVIRNELLKESIARAHTNHKPEGQNARVAIPLATHNSSNVSNHLNCNIEHSQSQSQDPPIATIQIGLPFNSNSYFQNLETQSATERISSFVTPQTSSELLSNTQRNYLHKDPRIQVKLNKSLTEHCNMDLAAVTESITVESTPTCTIDSETQTTLSFDRSVEIESKIISENNVYQHPRSKKMIVDQATETDFNMAVGCCDYETNELPSVESAPTVKDSACQTEEYLMEDQDSPYQEVASDNGIESDHKADSDYEASTDGSHVDIISEVNCLGELASLENNTGETLTTSVNITSGNQNLKSRLIAEQKLLDEMGTLFTQMNLNFAYAEELHNTLRNSMESCSLIHQTLSEKVKKLNATENLQISRSETRDVTKQSCGNKTKFVLPAGYDPNDSRWTLKYRESKPGLIELIPQSHVYVSKAGLRKCMRKSNDSRTLARMLLTEIFSKKALSVCSLTGTKAKAFSSVGIDVRPGLDEHARMVLLAFVDNYGSKQGWVTTDTHDIICSIRTKILEMRAKYGRMS